MATYNIIYNVNQGTINGSYPVVYLEGTGCTLPIDVTRDLFTFAGWYDNKTFTGNAITAISASEIGDKEYWAKWIFNEGTTECIIDDTSISNIIEMVRGKTEINSELRPSDIARVIDQLNDCSEIIDYTSITSGNTYVYGKVLELNQSYIDVHGYIPEIETAPLKYSGTYTVIVFTLNGTGTLIKNDSTTVATFDDSSRLIQICTLTLNSGDILSSNDGIVGISYSINT